MTEEGKGPDNSGEPNVNDRFAKLEAELAANKKAYEEATRKISEQGEELAQLKSDPYQRGSAYVAPQQMAEKQVDLFEDPNAWKENFKKEVFTGVQQYVQAKEAGKTVEEKFYSKYPELRDAKVLVDAESTAYRMANPGKIDLDKAIDAVAMKTKETIAKLVPIAPAKPPEFESGNQGVEKGQKRDDGPSKPLEELQAEAANDYVSRFNNRRV